MALFIAHHGLGRARKGRKYRLGNPTQVFFHGGLFLCTVGPLCWVLQEGIDEKEVEKFHRSAAKMGAAITRIIESNGLTQQVDRDRVASLKSKILELEFSIAA